jgi:Tfp pilus assembly protein PilX
MAHGTWRNSKRRAPRNTSTPSYTRVITGIRWGGHPQAKPRTLRIRMYPPRPTRDLQRGNSLLLALIVMSALATLGSLTVVSMQSSLKTSTNDRAQTIALYAAESGAAVAMAFLRSTFAAPAIGWTTWSAYVSSTNSNVTPLDPLNLSSNGALPGTSANLFSIDQNAWYDIRLLNNRDDPSYATGDGTNDTDGIVIIRSTGHGPQGALAIVEWEIQRVGYWASVASPPAPPPPVYQAFALFPPTLVPPASYPPSFPWGWVGTGYVPPAADFEHVGVVLRGYHIVSL